MQSLIRTLLILAAALALLWVIFGHSDAEPPWHLTNVKGHLPDLQFSMQDDTGKEVTEANYRNQVVLLYFGFTQCPDECPVTLSRLSTLLRQMKEDANPIRVLFVTVDPVHDTPQVLHEYLKAFNPQHMTGLAGSQIAVSDLAKRYHAAYETGAHAGEITHSDTIYVFDKQGHARLLASGSDSDSAIMDDLRRLAHESP